MVGKMPTWDLLDLTNLDPCASSWAPLGPRQDWPRPSPWQVIEKGEDHRFGRGAGATGRVHPRREGKEKASGRESRQPEAGGGGDSAKGDSEGEMGAKCGTTGNKSPRLASSTPRF